MKKITLLLVIIFTFFFSTTSWAEWTYVVETERGFKMNYDKDRIKKSGKFLYVWELTNYIKPFDGGLSHIVYLELDCSILRYKNLKYQWYENSMGEGEMTDSTPRDEWKYHQPDSSGEELLNKVCEEHQ